MRAMKPPIPTRDEFVAAWQELGGNVRALGRRFARDRRQIYRWAARWRVAPRNQIDGFPRAKPARNGLRTPGVTSQDE